MPEAKDEHERPEPEHRASRPRRRGELRRQSYRDRAGLPYRGGRGSVACRPCPVCGGGRPPINTLLDVAQANIGDAAGIYTAADAAAASTYTGF
jgi:hypothetical protein